MNIETKISEQPVVLSDEIIKLESLFKAADAREKRLIILRDALEQFNKGKYTVIDDIETCYLPFVKFITEDVETLIGTDMRQTIETVNCRLCQLGSFFCSMIRCEDNYKIPHCWDYSASHLDIDEGMDLLCKYFDLNQLRFVEAAYELGKGIYNKDYFYGEQREIYLQAVKFGGQFKTRKERLVGIINHMLENDGEFKNFDTTVPV